MNFKSFFRDYIRSLAVVLVAVVLSYVIVYYTPAAYPVQVLETLIVYFLSVLFGFPATLNADLISISYGAPLYRIVITPACTSLVEIAIGVSGVYLLERDRNKLLKRSLQVSGIVFIENIIRIWLTYPLVMAFGYQAWSSVHVLWWYYGQITFVSLILVYLYGIRPGYIERRSRTA